MRILVALACAGLLSGCGTRSATIVHAGLAGASLGGMLLVQDPPDSCGHSECDRVGPAVARAMLLTSAVGFGLAALVSYAFEPDEPRMAPAAPVPPAPPTRGDGPPGARF